MLSTFLYFDLMFEIVFRKVKIECIADGTFFFVHI